MSPARISEEAARKVMLRADLLPVGPYPGSQKVWPCICLTCGAECSPRYNSVHQGQGGCVPCGRRAKIETERALQGPKASKEMLGSGLRTLEPYLHSESPWLSECLKCGNRFRISLNNAVRRSRGCPYCLDSGHALGVPGCVYLVENTRLGAGKVGMSGGGRSSGFQARGWEVHLQAELASRGDCYKVEQEVLFWLRVEMKAYPFLTQDQMGGLDGYTETFSTGQVGIAEVAHKIRTLTRK